eukprot:scaffold167_cov110-Cylindrotheca_fusiformis.AAC.5
MGRTRASSSRTDEKVDVVVSAKRRKSRRWPRVGRLLVQNHTGSISARIDGLRITDHRLDPGCPDDGALFIVKRGNLKPVSVNGKWITENAPELGISYIEEHCLKRPSAERKHFEKWLKVMQQKRGASRRETKTRRVWQGGARGNNPKFPQHTGGDEYVVRSGYVAQRGENSWRFELKYMKKSITLPTCRDETEARRQGWRMRQILQSFHKTKTQSQTMTKDEIDSVIQEAKDEFYSPERTIASDEYIVRPGGVCQQKLRNSWRGQLSFMGRPVRLACCKDKAEAQEQCARMRRILQSFHKTKSESQSMTNDEIDLLIQAARSELYSPDSAVASDEYVVRPGGVVQQIPRNSWRGQLSFMGRPVKLACCKDKAEAQEQCARMRRILQSFHKTKTESQSMTNDEIDLLIQAARSELYSPPDSTPGIAVRLRGNSSLRGQLSYMGRCAKLSSRKSKTEATQESSKRARRITQQSFYKTKSDETVASDEYVVGSGCTALLSGNSWRGQLSYMGKSIRLSSCKSKAEAQEQCAMMRRILQSFHKTKSESQSMAKEEIASLIEVAKKELYCSSDVKGSNFATAVYVVGAGHVVRISSNSWRGRLSYMGRSVDLQCVRNKAEAEEQCARMREILQSHHKTNSERRSMTNDDIDSLIHAAKDELYSQSANRFCNDQSDRYAMPSGKSPRHHDDDENGIDAGVPKRQKAVNDGVKSCQHVSDIYSVGPGSISSTKSKKWRGRLSYMGRAIDLRTCRDKKEAVEQRARMRNILQSFQKTNSDLQSMTKDEVDSLVQVAKDKLYTATDRLKSCKDICEGKNSIPACKTTIDDEYIVSAGSVTKTSSISWRAKLSYFKKPVQLFTCPDEEEAREQLARMRKILQSYHKTRSELQSMANDEIDSLIQAAKDEFYGANDGRKSSTESTGGNGSKSSDHVIDEYVVPLGCVYKTSPGSWRAELSFMGNRVRIPSCRSKETAIHQRGRMRQMLQSYHKTRSELESMTKEDICALIQAAKNKVVGGIQREESEKGTDRKRKAATCSHNPDARTNDTSISTTFPEHVVDPRQGCRHKHVLIGRSIYQQWIDVRNQKVVVYGVISGYCEDADDETQSLFTVTYHAESRNVANLVSNGRGCQVPPSRMLKPELAWGGCLLNEERQQAGPTSTQPLLQSQRTVASRSWRWIVPDMVQEKVELFEGMMVPKLTLFVKGYSIVLTVRKSTIPFAGYGVFAKASYFDSDSGEESFDLECGELLDLGVYAPLSCVDKKKASVFCVKSYIHSYSPEGWSFDADSDDDMIYDVTDDYSGNVSEQAKSRVLCYVNECNGDANPTVQTEFDPAGAVHFLLGVVDEQETKFSIPTTTTGDDGSGVEIFAHYGDGYENVRLRNGYSRLRNAEERAERMEQLNGEDSEHEVDIEQNYSAEDVSDCVNYLKNLYSSNNNNSSIQRISLKVRERSYTILLCLQKRCRTLLLLALTAPEGEDESSSSSTTTTTRAEIECCSREIDQLLSELENSIVASSR